MSLLLSSTLVLAVSAIPASLAASVSSTLPGLEVERLSHAYPPPSGHYHQQQQQQGGYHTDPIAVFDKTTHKTVTDVQDTGVTQEEYDEFFYIVDNLLWDSEEGEEEGRQFRRGWMSMRRPPLFSRRNGSPAPMYRSLVDGCYGLLCSLGINGMINRIGRLLF